MRKKLIELLCKAHSKAIDEILFDDISYAKQLEIEADHLIQNGVVIPVRCKDCKHYLWHDWDYSYCCIKLGRFVKPDFGCLYGERKDNEEQT